MFSVIPVVLFAATFSLSLGIVLPLLSVDHLYIFSDSPSLVAIVAGLWRSGDWPLAGIIGLFSVGFPCLKLSLLHLVAYGGPDANRRVPGWMNTLANWSMLDVVLVALIVFAAKTSGLATAAAKPGLWFFAASAILTATASGIIRRAHP